MANAIACNGEEADLNWINSMMVGSMEPCYRTRSPTSWSERHGTRLVMTPLARVMAEHFIGMERLLEIIRLTKCNRAARYHWGSESEDVHKEEKAESKKVAGRKKRTYPLTKGKEDGRSVSCVTKNLQ